MTRTTQWHVVVEWIGNGVALNDAEIEELLTGLDDVHPVLTPIDPARLGSGSTHAYAVTVTLEVATLRQAVSTALQRVETAGEGSGIKAASVRALTQAAAEERLRQPLVPPLVGHADIAEMLAVSRQRAAQLAARDDFPPAVAQIKAGPLRLRSQVEAWAKGWERKGGRPPG